MMDRKELVGRCLEVVYGGGAGNAYTVQERAEALADLLTELSGGKAQSPLTLRATTRGEEAVGEFLARNRGCVSGGPILSRIVFGRGDVRFVAEYSSDAEADRQETIFRNTIATLIDAERADAVKAERQACAEKLRALRSATDWIELGQ